MYLQTNLPKPISAGAYGLWAEDSDSAREPSFYSQNINVKIFTKINVVSK